ncbi:MAG: cytochrome c biogenesis protein CcdA [Gammaproteobacteria bacterium]|nr:cytochrome c biogenesis protein CcdA [Gammaproteobacteria bacterium]MDH3416010.1 cytochrome c biogenesis protein CcdA [Gammaproteobacteria bacterium]
MNTKTTSLDSGLHSDESPQRGAWFSRHQAVVTALLVTLTLLIAASWLVFPYYVKDHDLIASVGGSVKQEKLRNAISIGQFLNRTTFGSGEAQVDVLYATPKYFAVTDRAQAVTQFRPDLYLVFLVTETTHTEDLPRQLPDAVLKVDGREYAPFDVEGPLEVYHHRVVTLRFPAYGEDGTPVLPDESTTLELQLFNTWDPDDSPRIVSWDLPLAYPEALENPGPWTPVMVLGLSAGLLSFVLTPCLLQLLVVYVVTLTGFSVDQLRSGTAAVPVDVRRKLLMVAASFVVGLTALFTLTGAGIGHAGKQMQMFFAVWSPTLSVISGIIVILMGLWIGVRSRAPLVCRLVPEKMLKAQSHGVASYFGSALIAVGFSLGCITCFGGAIIATLLIYVGSLGSALVGATVMFGFSMGVVIPFLLAAFFLSRTMPLLSKIHLYAPTIGFVGMLVIVAFGIVLVTDNFHVLSDLIYPWLGLDS